MAEKKADIRTVLVIVAGLTPQVITETLYSLTQDHEYHIDDIHAWTTLPGKKQLIEHLIDGEGRFFSFCRDYDLNPPPVFHIHVFKGIEGEYLNDIRTATDNEVVADQLIRFLQQQTADEKVRLLCSLSGGRKTSGTYLALGLQLFGRPQDELFHVLVSPELEHDRNFYYPLPGDDRANELFMARVPLVLLRQYVPNSWRTEQFTNYTDLVREVQQDLARLTQQPLLRIQPTTGEIRIDEQLIEMSRLEKALFIYFVRRRMNCQGIDCAGCNDCYLSIADVDQIYPELKEILKKMNVKDDRYNHLNRWESKAMVKEHHAPFYQTLSKLNAKIRKTIGEVPWSVYYQVKSLRRKDDFTLYGIALPPSRIDWLSTTTI